MVAIIKTGHSLHRTLNYNDNKVKEGVAACISAVNYPMEAEDLSLKYKLNRLLNQAALNENVSRNSVHISLNFDPSEKLSVETLKAIANNYMDRIGFGAQPYLVYQHHDAAHPHIHIVSLKIMADGTRIDTQNIGRNQSEKARREIEISYGLKPAEQNKKEQAFELKAYSSGKAQYGKAETRRAITNVLDVVLNQYKYTSLAELNAVLKQYNVLADLGSENSRIYNNKGLVYRILDEQGNKVGVPIKASLIYSKPTLACLEQKYFANEQARQLHKGRVKTSIDLALLRRPSQSLPDLISTLKKEGISTVLRQNESGLIYGLTYVDHKTKCVFNGSELGKQYSANGILERIATTKAAIADEQQSKQTNLRESLGGQMADPPYAPRMQAGSEIIDALVQPQTSGDFLPGQLTKKEKKRRKKTVLKSS
ncbi:relaxase [Segetibacter sp. 3557_3]|uniref:relaxase/mobilization nuclease domain-containing protein n=1 Tax=Segetibacter sp. 3557_3 TaxID=2547429 RepID=UPI0010591B2E|nr:relaxase/mobilization nuclease domain-containing protein [Segetibacter sp. 3557_3]TDH28084.1 relaxase [Segetibacter sp. 3557_3]